MFDPTTFFLPIVECNGVQIAIDSRCMSPRMQQVILAGQLSQPEAGLLLRALAPGERLLELGGGIGYTSSLAAIQNKAASITTIEANPQLLPSMRQTHALNGVLATTLNAVVVAAKQTETVPFYIHQDFWVSSLIRPPSGVVSVVNVPVIELSEILRTYFPTMLMIDIEGAELTLLQDADVPGVQKVLIELHPTLYGEAGVRRMFNAFTTRGFAYQPHLSAAQVAFFQRCSTMRQQVLNTSRHID